MNRHHPEQYGYVLLQLPNGKWCIADPEDDEDGFYVECDSKEEAIFEWIHCVDFAELEGVDNMYEYRIQYNVGKVKYLVSWHDGIKKHKDGSDFWDIACFKSQKKMNNFIASMGWKK